MDDESRLLSRGCPLNRGQENPDTRPMVESFLTSAAVITRDVTLQPTDQHRLGDLTGTLQTHHLAGEPHNGPRQEICGEASGGAPLANPEWDR